ncbi:type ISP restriction/modification enzyme [Corynebacterium striatum]|nr:type ISP restriction/modification enzyme [Corynebacterium sp. CCUG 65737]
MPTYDTAVGVGMPDDVTYDETTQTIYLGKGSWSNVSPAVWNYTVGGNSTIKSWVGYRRKKPKGRKSSPLDDIITTSWPTQWSRQFHELLVTLTHLIQLEAEQKELLEQIIAGEQLTKDELAFHGVQWPAENKDRKPHFPGDLF